MIASLVLVAACSWDAPGRNPFRGDVAAAVASYSDIPDPARAELRRKVAVRQYDELAEIRPDTIVGKEHNYADLRDMHFGTNRRCAVVTRNWAPGVVERGLVYCVEEHCIIVPTVCNNVSRVTRAPRQAPATARAGERSAPPPAAEPSPPGNPAEGPPLAGGSSFESTTPASIPEHPPVPGPTLQDSPSVYAVPFPLYPYERAPYYVFAPGIPSAPVVPLPPMSPVPEPSTGLLALAGLAALAAAGRR